MIEIGWEQKVYPATKIALVVDALSAEGVPAGEGLRGTGVSPEQLRASSTLISVNQVIEAYRNALRLSRDADFAFRTGLRTHLSLYGMYGFAILSSVSYRETMRFAVRYHQLATPLVKMRIVEEALSAAPTAVAALTEPGAIAADTAPSAVPKSLSAKRSLLAENNPFLAAPHLFARAGSMHFCAASMVAYIQRSVFRPSDR